MIIDAKIANQTSKFLLQINAIKLNSKNPFRWASGWNSPIYCDNRVILSFPEIRTFVINQMSKQIQSIYIEEIIIAGVATGGIGIGALIANKLNKPFIYVRPENKKHGRKNQIEGINSKNKKVIVIEDLISSGNSCIKAIEALKSEGAEVLGVFSIFNYGFNISKINFKNLNINVCSLSDYENLILVAKDLNKITTSEMDILKKWRQNPSKWTINK